MSKIQKIGNAEFVQLLKQDMIENQHYCREDYDGNSEYELAVSEFNDISTIEQLVWKLADEGWDAPGIMKLLVSPFVEIGNDMQDMPLHYDT